MRLVFLMFCLIAVVSCAPAPNELPEDFNANFEF